MTHARGSDRLPIFDVESEVRAALAAGEPRRMLVRAPTGSGKSTQIPQMLLDSGRIDGQIVVLQPRRLAARLLAARVASERGRPLGTEVGYQIRFDDCTSAETRIRFVTEGILLRQLLSDPLLRGIGAILFDEFHERHLYGDITLARCLDVQEAGRPDLLLGVMSATLDAGPLERYLAGCLRIESEGRMFPVDIRYLDRPPDMTRRGVWDLAADEVEAALSREREGDILVFMPGSFEIARTVQAVRDRCGSRGLVVLPLHGELQAQDQDAAVARYDARKVVVATNVAETSITIDGIRAVIDSGLARIARFDPYRGINTLLVEKIAQSSCDQRAGRAGRTAPGVCVRLWTEREHRDRPAQETPEVRRLDLAEVVLALKAGGVRDVHAFRWLEPPEWRALDRAESLLKDLGALDEAGDLTPIGRRMLAFPLHPRYGRMLLAASELRCVKAAALIAALTQSRPLFVRNPGRDVEERRNDLLGDEAVSDFLPQMRAFLYAQKTGFDPKRCAGLGVHAQGARQVGQLFDQFLDLAQKERLPIDDAPPGDEALQRCVLAGFADQVAVRQDEGTLRCHLLHGRRGMLVRDSVVRHAELVVAAEVREVQQGATQEVQVLLSLVTKIEEDWLADLFPEAMRREEEVVWDAGQRRVVARRLRMFRDLVLESSSVPAQGSEKAAALLAERVLAGELKLTGWDDADDQWIVRLNNLRGWMPELELPLFDDEARALVIQEICAGAASYKEIKDRPARPALDRYLSKSQRDLLERFAPTHYQLPGGRRAKLTYVAGQPPTLGARIQDLYEVEGSVYVADRRVRVVIQVLAPNQRPVQVTDNLSTFWKESYPKLKQELQRKYPKHVWR